MEEELQAEWEKSVVRGQREESEFDVQGVPMASALGNYSEELRVNMQDAMAGLGRESVRIRGQLGINTVG